MRIAALLLVLVATPASAQVPETFTNLQVLPETTTRPELIALMRSFSFALGVSCSNCHVTSDAPGGPPDEFASDAKPAKN